MKNKFAKYLASTAMLAAGLSLSACISVLPDAKAAPTVYRLSVPGTLAVNTTDQSIVVNIDYPKAPKALGGTDIVLSPDGRRLTAAAAANWSEPMPSLLRNVLIDTLSKDGKISGVIPNGSTRVPYRLNMDIRRFESVFDQGEDAPPLAVIQINLSLVDTSTRQIIGTHSIEETVRASQKSVSSIVRASDQVSQTAMQNAADWMSAQLVK